MYTCRSVLSEYDGITLAEPKRKSQRIGPAALLLFLLFCLHLPLAGQAVSTADLPPYEIDNLIQGRLYSPNYFPIRGNPFFNEAIAAEKLQLLDKTYRGLALWYDIYADAVILMHKEGADHRFLQLNKEQVQFFTLGERRFINLPYSPYRNLAIPAGYYEVAFEDQISLLVKRALEVKTEGEDLISSFERNDRRYLIRSGTAFPMRNKKSLREALDKTAYQQLAAFIKKQKITMKNAGDEDWQQIAAYLNNLQADSQ